MLVYIRHAQLSLNLAEKTKRPVSGFDLDTAKGAATCKAAAAQGGLPVSAFSSLPEFVASLEQPRRVVLLVPAGKPVESAIASLLPLLDAGDVLVDMGNEWYDAIPQRTALSASSIAAPARSASSVAAPARSCIEHRVSRELLACMLMDCCCHFACVLPGTSSLRPARSESTRPACTTWGAASREAATGRGEGRACCQAGRARRGS